MAVKKVMKLQIPECLTSVKCHMCDMAEVVLEQEKKAKRSMKAFYDRSAKEKSFRVGDLVLVRKTGLHSKLGDVWDGPHQVVEQVTPVNYSVQVDDVVEPLNVYTHLDGQIFLHCLSAVRFPRNDGVNEIDKHLELGLTVLLTVLGSHL